MKAWLHTKKAWIDKLQTVLFTRLIGAFVIVFCANSFVCLLSNQCLRTLSYKNSWTWLIKKMKFDRKGMRTSKSAFTPTIIPLQQLSPILFLLPANCMYWPAKILILGHPWRYFFSKAHITQFQKSAPHQKSSKNMYQDKLSSVGMAWQVGQIPSCIKVRKYIM